ncbi:MFS transporter [Legionella spiritensis]|uniref:Transporter of the major facilitator superfamily (MFS) n=1 Tax=Legionella spiritensis TaxID=452 RepID=A0A0W0YZ12_LEGSP|nr:MFS transporter [Legionella spiritensis]KTD62113.1 transporter of the major facilitator superfamily (MFS) [Legionella spiritensis]SNV34175.1 transporter of the major facilitator superfamily (MFS) [Legionella spiritensis]
MNKNSNEKFIKFLMTLVVLIDFMGVAIVVVLFPHIFLDQESLLFSSAWEHADKLIALGACLAVYPLGQFFGSSIFGKLSDYYGRKTILGWTLLGTLSGFVLSAVSIEIGSFILLFMSRLLTGLCAGNVAVAQASLADISTDETKAKNLSLAQMAMGSAYVIGPVIGAFLADSTVVSWFNPSIPFIFFSGILCVELMLLVLYYKDTSPANNRIKLNFFEGIQQISSALTDKKTGGVFTVWFLFVAGWWLFESFMPSFIFEKFNFNTSDIGILLGFNGALYASFQYLVIQKIASKISPIKMVIFATPVSGLAIISIAFAMNIFQLYSAMIVFVLSMGFCIPGLITSISNMVKTEDQGQIMGMIGSIQALATVIVMLSGGYIHGFNMNTTIVGGGILVLFSWFIFAILSMNKTAKKEEVKAFN